MNDTKKRYGQLKLFVGLLVLGWITQYNHVHIPHTEVLIDGRWAFGFMGFALLRHWWAALVMAACLSIPFGTEISFLAGFFGNMLYAVPSLLVIRPISNYMLKRWGTGWIYGLGWLVLTLFCYQVFTTPAVWAVLALIENVPVWQKVLEGWRIQPFLIESILVALFSAAAMVALLTHQWLSRSQRRLDHIYHVLLGIRNVNQLIVQENDPKRLIERACITLTETMGYHNAWIALMGVEAGKALGLSEDGSLSNSELIATVESGFNGGFEEMIAQLKSGKMPACMKRTLATDETVVIENPKTECPDCPLSKKYESRSGLSHRLTYAGKTYGFLSISVPSAYAHDTEEQALFAEVAGDLAFALHKIDSARRMNESERRYQEIFEGSRDGFVMIYPNGRIFDANKGYCEMLGYSLEELREMSDFYQITPERWHEWETEEIVKKRLLGQGHSGIYEKEYIRKDGKIIPVELRAHAVWNENGMIEYIWGTVRDITERKQAEETLRESERYLRTILQTTAEGFWVLDNQGSVIDVNDAYCNMIGYSRDEIMGLRIGDLDAEERPKETEARIRRIIANGSELFEASHRRKDGSILPVEVSATWLESKNGRFVCFCRDLTERKQQQERIALLGRMLDDAPASITIHNSDGHFLYANHKTFTLHGYKDEDEFLAVNLHGLDVPASEILIKERLRRITEKGEATFEVSHYRKDGSTFPLEVQVKVIVWEGQPAFLSIATDITERKQAEEALRESERQKDLVLNATSEMVAYYDTDLRIIWANRAAGISVGKSPEELVGMHCYRLWNHNNQPCDDCPVIKARENKTPHQTERHTQDGKHWLLRGYPILDEDNNIVGLAEFGQDITERKRTEAEREKLREQLTHAQKLESVGRLAGGVAHDFNNMLNVILGHIELAIDEFPADDPLRAGMEEIQKAARRSADLTRQLLAFARKQTIIPKVLDLNDTVENMFKMLRRLIGEDIDLLWQPDGMIEPIRIDPAQIDQLLVNLVVNARDAIKHDLGKITIETEHVSFDKDYCTTHQDLLPGNYIMLAVSDNGCGMNKDTIDQVFEPFFTTKGLGEGTGLGLSTVYGIVKQNKGFINVYSEPGQGTTFKIYLPVYRAGKAIAVSEQVSSMATARGNETILLVEDEPASLDMTRIMLERLGYMVLAASTPGEAISLAEEHAGEIHLLFTDVVMPEMNGRTLAKKLLSLYPNLKRLFMSGYTANVIAHRNILDEGVNFIQKPYSQKDLGVKVREALDK